MVASHTRFHKIQKLDLHLAPACSKLGIENPIDCGANIGLTCSA